MERTLLEDEAGPDPIRLFKRWFEEAREAVPVLPEGMTLATTTVDGAPSARVVLLKEVDERGFLFYTNLESRKGAELAENPRAALVFWWSPLERQVRIEGQVEKVPDAEADAYFRNRHRGSQLGAWASAQSRAIPDRGALERRFEALAEEYRGREVPRPSFWGGYRVFPTTIEFFQSRPDRLNDRLHYRRVEDGNWRMERLAP